MKAWFNALEKREQVILIGGAVATVFIMIFYFYSNLTNDMRLYQTRNKAAAETLSWMEGAVHTLKQAGGTSSGGGNSAFANMSLAQLSEKAAQRSGLRVTRFQPNGNTEAQVWFDRVPFNGVVDFVGRLELDYGIEVDTLAVNSANQPGIVNARIKFSR